MVMGLYWVEYRFDRFYNFKAYLTKVDAMRLYLELVWEGANSVRLVFSPWHSDKKVIWETAEPVFPVTEGEELGF